MNSTSTPNTPVFTIPGASQTPNPDDIARRAKAFADKLFGARGEKMHLALQAVLSPDIKSDEELFGVFGEIMNLPASCEANQADLSTEGGNNVEAHAISQDRIDGFIKRFYESDGFENQAPTLPGDEQIKAYIRSLTEETALDLFGPVGGVFLVEIQAALFPPPPLSPTEEPLFVALSDATVDPDISDEAVRMILSLIKLMNLHRIQCPSFAKFSADTWELRSWCKARDDAQDGEEENSN